MFMRTVLLATCLSGGLLAGCSSAPKYRIDDALLADVSPQEKQGIFAAQSQLNMVQAEQSKANSDLAITERDVTAAESEYGKAKLDVNTAKGDRDLAESTKDVKRLQEARAKLEDAEMARDVAEAKLDWQKARRKHAKSVIEATEIHGSYASALVEQEKAHLAQQKGKSPSPDFNPALFDQQAADRQSKWDRYKADAERAQLRATELEGKYNQLNQRLTLKRGMAPAGGVAYPPPSYPPQNQPPPDYQQPGAYPQPQGQPGAYPQPQPQPQGYQPPQPQGGQPYPPQ